MKISHVSCLISTTRRASAQITRGSGFYPHWRQFGFFLLISFWLNLFDLNLDFKCKFYLILKTLTVIINTSVIHPHFHFVSNSPGKSFFFQSSKKACLLFGKSISFFSDENFSRLNFEVLEDIISHALL